MSYDSENTPKQKWQRAIKRARNKPASDEPLRPGEHHLHAEHANKRRIALSLDDVDKQIRSFYELE